MIVLEHDAGVLRRGDRPFHALSDEERRTVLTHWYKRHAGVVDGTTSEPATQADQVALLHRTRKRSGPTTREQMEAHDAGVRRLEALAERARTGGPPPGTRR